MTLLTQGLAEEVRAQNVAVNSLWPATIIESRASINWGLGTTTLNISASHMSLHPYSLQLAMRSCKENDYGSVGATCP
jgi:hypothetical protein